MIAVLGATGRIGRHVAAGLADQSVDARAMIRRPGAADVALPTVSADLSDPPSVRAALEGATRLFLLTPHGPDQDLLEPVAIDAAADADVEHVVKISGSAASLGPNGTTSTGTAHWRSEQRIERAGMGFTFLRPSFFQQNLLSNVAPIVATTGVRLDDVAAHLGVRHVPIPPKAAGRALARRGESAADIDHAVRMAASFTAGADGAPTDHVLQLTGRAPRPVRALLDEQRHLFAPTTALARLLSRTPTLKD